MAPLIDVRIIMGREDDAPEYHGYIVIDSSISVEN